MSKPAKRVSKVAASGPEVYVPPPRVRAQKTEDIAKAMGRRIQEAREGFRISQQILCGRTQRADHEGRGISRAALSLYETGVNKPGAREIKLLCEALKVSPNWLFYGNEAPANAIQPSLDYMRGDDLILSIRLAYSILAMDATDRESLAAIVYSLLNNKYGDVKLSMIMTTANEMRQDFEDSITKYLGEGAESLSTRELVERFSTVAMEGYSNYGTLRPSMTRDELDDFDPNIPPPPRKLK